MPKNKSVTGRYIVNVGINYPEGKRAEPGDVVSDLPDYCIEELLLAGVIVEETK